MATDIILRSVKAAALTHAEMDQNWESLAQTVDAKTANYTILFSDQNKIIECSISSGTITLPTLASAAGTDTDSFRVTIKNVNATSLTVEGNGSETIEGALNVILLENEVAVFALESAALEWNIVGFYGPNLVGITATATELNTLDGITSSTTELNYVNGVTSAIQTQLDSKLASASNLSDVGSAATSRTNLNVDVAGTDNSTDVTLTGIGYLSLSGQALTANLVNLASHVTGLLAEASLDDDVGFTQVFTSSGTFTAPKTGNYLIILISAGGGGGGGAGGDFYFYSGNTGGSGGVGGSPGNSRYKDMSLTEGTNYTVTLGSGGAGGAGGAGGGNNGVAGSTGGTTTFNGNSVTGGSGGGGGTTAGTAAGTAGGPGKDSDPFNFGGGGAGGTGGASPTVGSTGGQESGGGGGGGGNQSGAVAGAAGGTGGVGQIIISW